MKPRRSCLLLTLAACAFAGAAIPTSAYGQQASDTVLVDPIIEEPLRPLFLNNPGTAPNDPSACGLVGAATIPLTLLLLQMLGVTGMKRRNGFLTQERLTDDELE